MPNAVAYLALALWPLISVLFFVKFNRCTATFITIVGGTLLLPARVSFDLPLIPPLDKQTIPVLTALTLNIVSTGSIRFLLPEKPLEKAIVACLLILPVCTMLTNTGPMFDGQELKPGLGVRDAISLTISVYLAILPFILAVRLVRSPADMLAILTVIVVAALLYAPLILFEVRMSPRLHGWVYGFFPSSFAQQIRFDGFRPVVFLGHGLAVAMFVAVAMVCSAILQRMKRKLFGFPPVLATVLLLVVLVLCKSVGAFILGVSATALILFFPRLGIKSAAKGIVVVFLLYPALCITGSFPHQALVDMAANINADRAQSLEFRFDNEEVLLEHARQKPLFGWGAWGRNRPARTITDGAWIITLGTYGVLGFLLLYALPCMAVLGSGPGRRFVRLDLFLSSLTLLVAIVLIDQIPNSSLWAWLWFVVGGISAVRRYRPVPPQRQATNGRVEGSGPAGRATVADHGTPI